MTSSTSPTSSIACTAWRTRARCTGNLAEIIAFEVSNACLAFEGNNDEAPRCVRKYNLYHGAG